MSADVDQDEQSETLAGSERVRDRQDCTGRIERRVGTASCSYLCHGLRICRLIRYTSWAAKLRVMHVDPTCQRRQLALKLDDVKRKRRQQALDDVGDLARLVIQLLSDAHIDDTRKKSGVNKLVKDAMTKHQDM